jgi:uncharacterized membrane protein YdbT with pleckstrin-like domain
MAKRKNKDKYFEEQYDDEEMLLLFRKHPVVMRKALIIASLALLLGIIPSLLATFIDSWLDKSMQLFIYGLLGGLLLASVVMFWAWMGWYFSVFIVTNQRFIQVTQKGLFHRTFVDVGLDKIQSINYQVSGIQETVLGFGTILIQTYIGDLAIHEAHHPRKVSQELSHILREVGVSSVPPVAQGKDDEGSNE